MDRRHYKVSFETSDQISSIPLPCQLESQSVKQQNWIGGDGNRVREIWSEVKNHFHLELTKGLGYRRLQTAALLVVDLAGNRSPHLSHLDDDDCCHGCWHYSGHYYHCHCWSSGCLQGPRTPRFLCLHSGQLEHSPKVKRNHTCINTPSFHLYISIIYIVFIY